MKEKILNIPIGKIIAKRRKNKGLTQEVVAELLDITIEAVSRMERGTIMPSLKRLEQYAEIFDCTIIELLSQSSHRIDDQSTYIRDLLAQLDENDRVLVVEMIEKLTERLKQ